MCARWSTGTSSRWTSSRPPLRSSARPPAARPFWTQCTCPPSIDTSYRCPSTTATTTGSETVRPDLRPVTSNVTYRLDATPDETTAAHTRLSILAIQLDRCPRYNHLLKSLRVISASVPSLSCTFDQDFRPLPHVWSKNRAEPFSLVRSIRGWPHMAISKGSFPITRPSQEGGSTARSARTLPGGRTCALKTISSGVLTNSKK